MTPLDRITADLSSEDRAAFIRFCEGAYISFTDESELKAARETWVTWDRPDISRLPALRVVAAARR